MHTVLRTVYHVLNNELLDTVNMLKNSHLNPH